MEIRKCTAEEISVLYEIARKTFADTFGSDNTIEDMEAYLDESLSMDRVREEVGNEESVFYLALEDSGAVGYLKLNHAPAQTDVQDDASVEIERIYLLHSVQGKGYGKLLMEHAMKYAEDSGKEYVWLGVWEHNKKAVQFYERNGFYKFGEHIFRIGGDEQTDHLMRRDI